MPTAVLDLELSRVPSEVRGLEGCDRALALIRFHGRPLGQALFSVAEGRIASAELDSGIRHAVDENYWHAWIHDWLGWSEPRAPGFERPSVTVAICTRDRPDD